MAKPRRRTASSRRDAKFERRSARNRVVILVMAILMGLSLLAVPLTLLLERGGDAAASDDPGADDVAAALSDGAAGAADVDPCPPSGGDVPDVDSRVYDESFGVTVEAGAEYEAVLDTTCGEIRIALDAENAPLAVSNLVELADDGYYEGVVFHRVVPGFVVQVGDPAGTGCGQDDCTPEGFDDDAPTYPGYTFPDELTTAEALFEDVRDEQLRELIAGGVVDEADLDDETRQLVPGGYPRGVVAMANAGPDTNGSQFFITQADPTTLPGPSFTVLGRVIDGMDVVDAIAAVPTDARDRPLDDVVVRRVEIDVR